MMRKCVIEGCSSKSGTPQHRGVTFHSFPLDPKIRDIWLKNCHLIDSGKSITKNNFVCSRHFRRVDFQSIKSNKFMLKKGSVPTIFPWGKVQSDGKTSNLNSDLNEQSEKSDTMESQESLTQENDSNEFQTPLKRSLESDTEEQQSVNKMPKLSLSYDDLSPEINCVSGKPAVTNTPDIPHQRKTDSNPSGFTLGVKIEAQDFNGVWHTAKVVEVDSDEREVLIRFDKSRKSKTTGVEEWIPMNSSRLRQIAPQGAKKIVPLFEVGEKCSARWSGPRRFPATVTKVLGNDTYEVLFDDGYMKVVKGHHMSKVKQKSVPKSPTTSVKNKSQTKKDWPLISISSLNLEELNLPDIPKDGEWCCHWVNDQPIGQEGFLTVGDHKKPTVIVEDWRLPPNWIKHMYQRSNVLGKWDVILVNPQGKRFRSKADLKQYIEELGQVYNPDVYDFSIHRRRAKDIGAYVYTKDYKPPPPPVSSSQQFFAAQMQSTKNDTASPGVSTGFISPTSSEGQFISKEDNLTLPIKLFEEDKKTNLEDGYVYVGSLKVQIVDNLFRCPQEDCNKNFRKENHLQIHVKHYHRELAKLLGVCPNMQDLACKRTIGTVSEEPLPKNHLPNVQFFAKLHQQDIASKTHRKSIASATAPPILSSQSSDANSSIEANKTDLLEISTTSLNSEIATPSIDTNKTSQSSKTKSSYISPTPIEQKQLEIEEDVSHRTPVQALKSREHKPTSTKMKKSNVKDTFGNRKSSRQKLSKKYIKSGALSSSRMTFDTSTANIGGSSDQEETRHSFNGDNSITEVGKSLKKFKPEPLSLVSETNLLDVTSQSQTTAGSIQESSQSPKYISENGEIIKIVRMRQEEIINCLCSYGEEDGLMIQCELCLCWQHGICNGIEKESQVPEKYICYICRNPQRGRSSLKYIHDQDWMYEGKLPVASYHAPSPVLEERFEVLRKTHILTGNLLELKKFLHSLRVKINIAENKDHPKMYLWTNKWESSPAKSLKVTESDRSNENISKNDENEQKDDLKNVKRNELNVNENEGNKNSDNSIESNTLKQPTIPQPEAPIDPVECQHRLMEHIKNQQSFVMDRLQIIESQVFELDSLDNTESDCEPDDYSKTKENIAMYIKDLETMKNIAKINTVQVQSNVT